MTKIRPARMPKKALLEIERTGASLRSLEPFVRERERCRAMHQSARNPHDETREPLIIDRVEPDTRHAHRRIIGIPWRRREAHQRTERSADQRRREQARCGNAVTRAALARVKHRPPEQKRADEETGVLCNVPAKAVERAVEQDRKSTRLNSSH